MKNFLEKIPWIARIICWYKIRKCKSQNHVRANHFVIEKFGVEPWDEPRGGKVVRKCHMKIRCETCKTIFLRKNCWDWKWADEQFSAD